jgi:CBS domain
MRNGRNVSGSQWVRCNVHPSAVWGNTKTSFSCTNWRLNFLRRLKLEFCRAADVMTRPVETIHSRETVCRLAQLLISTSQSGFPVVGMENDDDADEMETETVYGMLTRYIWH